MKSHSLIIKKKASEQYFPVAPFIMLYKKKAVLTFESVVEIVQCDN